MEKLKPYLTINVMWPLAIAIFCVAAFIKYSITAIDSYSSESQGAIWMIGLILLLGIMAYVFFRIAMGNKKTD